MSQHLSRGIRIVRFVWIAGFVIGTTTHITDLVLGVLVMLADVAVNWTVFATFDGFGLPGLVNQSLFCVFVLATAIPLWRAFSTRTRAQQPTGPGRTTRPPGRPT